MLLRFTMLWVVVGVLMLCAGTQRSYAQGQNRAAAADAYDRGTAAYLSGDYEQAAGWFETANRLAPAGAALQQAIRAHLRTQDEARAATLALQLQQSYANDSQFRVYADEVLSDLAPTLVRVRVLCDSCELSLEGKVLPSTTFFVEAGGTHTLTAAFTTGDITKVVSGEAGSTVSISLEAPPAKVEPEPVAQVNEGDSLRFQVGSMSSDSRAPLSPAVTLIAAGITVGVALATTISGVAAIRAGDEFDEARDSYRGLGCLDSASTASNRDACSTVYSQITNRYDVATAAELRTNVLLGASLASLATTAVLAAFFTDWEGDSEEAPQVSISVSPNGQAFGRMAVRF